VTLGSEHLALTADGLDPGEYTVLIDDGAGSRAVVGSLSVSLADREGTSAAGGGDRAWGELRLEAPGLPFEAASPLELAGSAIDLFGADGVPVLAGKLPMPISEEADERAGRCPIGRPQGAPDPDAEGVLRIESGAGRVVLKLHIRKLEPATVYRVTFVDPADGAAESAGMITTSDDGNGQFKVDSAKGDPIPFGAGTLASLAGLRVEVEDPNGLVVLAGSICEARVLESEDDEVEGGKECLSELEAPDPAPLAGAEGEVEVEVSEEKGAELEVELKIIIPAAAFDVFLTDPTDGGASEAIGRVVIGCEGIGELEIKDHESPAIPFGKESVVDLAGFLVTVRDETGAVVLNGTVPALDCPDIVAGEGDGEGDDHGEVVVPPCSISAVPAHLMDEPLFRMVGDFDALFRRGDANGDGAIDISDSVFALAYLFAGGPRPACLDAADFDDDGAVAIADPVETLNHLFLGGVGPPRPGTLITGSDPTPDRLYCAE
jgi:hypothetical protein